MNPMILATSSEPKVRRSVPSAGSVTQPEPAFPWYIGAALAVAVGGGFALAILLPLAVTLDWGWETRWRALVQAHGHLQLIGWTGLFVLGMLYRLTPRFAGRPLRFAQTAPAALSLLLVALVARLVGQPWHDTPAMAVLLDLSALAELAATLLVAVTITGTLAPVARSMPSAPLFVLGTLGLVAQAALGGLWLVQLPVGEPALPPHQDAALVTIQVYGFLLPVAVGVLLRMLPTFFQRTAPGSATAWLIAAALATGTTLSAGAELLRASAAGAWLWQAGALALAAAIAGALAPTGAWRPAARLRPAARDAALLIRTACAWLALVAAALAVEAVRTLVSGQLPPPYLMDAMRHLLALGFFATLIMGVARLVLPWLALRRFGGRSARREARTLWVLLTSATALRVAGALLEGLGVGSARYDVMAAAGVLGLLAVVVFAVSVIRAAHPAAPPIAVHSRMD